jgi:hypothetical protein
MSLLETFTQAFSGDRAGQIGKAVGLSPEQVERGIAVAGPVILSALVDKVSTQSGLDMLLEDLPSGGSKRIGFGDLLALLKPGTTQKLMKSVFGPGVGAVAGSCRSRPTCF